MGFLLPTHRKLTPLRPVICAPKLLSPQVAADRRAILAATGLLVILTVAASANGFFGGLLYDDRACITENESIRRLGDLGNVLTPPPEAGTGGRPLANLTFALSYALSGFSTWGYHAVNVITHLLAALTLFGVVRRTLLQPALQPRFGLEATPLAGAIATLWALHPLQTQVVTYLSQRTESLMALFYLLTLYCFIRGAEARSSFWYPLAVLACVLGVLSKEVIATAPLMVLLYDRTFVAGSFAGAWRLRWRLYTVLAATWIPLAFFLIGVRDRGVGYGLGVPWFQYALTECKAIIVYLGLSVWPQTLIFDRGVTLVSGLGAALPFVFGLVVILGATSWALWARPVLGFVGAWFFVILAPTSSVVPVIQQPIAENRPYLPLAAVITLVVIGLRVSLDRRVAWIVCAALAVVSAFATIRRNRDFVSEISIWTDTVAKAPGNARAHYNLGVALDYAGRTPEAVVHYRNALTVEPNHVEAKNNLGNALVEQGSIAEGIALLEGALRLRPAYADAHYNLGNALLHSGRPADAIRRYQASLRIEAKQPKARNNMGVAMLQTGRVLEAMREFELSLTLNPGFADPHNNLAVALDRLGRVAEAIAHCEAALRLKPDYTDARNNLGNLRATLTRAGPDR